MRSTATPVKHRRYGFTLIELLIVIAIIAILAAILFPVFARARAKARQVKCLSNQKQLGLALQMYVSDHDGFFPKRENVGDWATRGGWPVALYSYVKHAEVYRCPSDKTPYSPAGLRGTPVERVSYLANSQIVKTAPPRHEAELEDVAALLCLTDANTGGEIRNGDLNGVGAVGSIHERVEANHSDGLNVLFCDGHAKWLSYATAVANRDSLIPNLP